MTTPRVAVVDAPGGGYLDEPDIEQGVLEGHADVRLVIVPEGTPAHEAEIDAEYVILWHRVSFDAAFFAKSSGCRGVVCASVGYDHVDVAAARAAGVPLYHVPHYGTEEVADHTLALMLALTRRIPVLQRHVHSGGWDWRAIGVGSARRLRGATCGVIGLGRIGTAVAQRARAFGMDVVFHDPYNHPGIEKSLGVERVPDLDELLARSDIVTVHVPLTPDTRHLLGQRELGLMKQGSVLVNTARGAVIDSAALFGALQDGRPALAGLDVVEGEPEIPRWLAEHPQTLLTPHVAFYATESLAELRTRAAEAVLQQISATPVTSAVEVPCRPGPEPA
jgi:phosphoglycerate dehydrogenase-like enzyme